MLGTFGPSLCESSGRTFNLIGFIILVVYRSLIDGGYSHETTPLAGSRVLPPSG